MNDKKETKEVVREATIKALGDIDDTFKTGELVKATQKRLENEDVAKSSIKTYVYDIIKDLKDEHKITKLGWGKYLLNADYSIDKMNKEVIKASQSLNGPMEGVEG